MRRYKEIIKENLENHNIQVMMQGLACYFICISNGVLGVLYLHMNHVSVMYLLFPLITLCQFLLYIKSSKEYVQPTDILLVFVYPVGTVVFLKRQLEIWIGKQK